MDLFIIGILKRNNGIDKWDMRSFLKYLIIQIINFLMSGNIIIIARKNHSQNLFNSLDLANIQIKIM
ncbi:hypothetical protein C1646_701895 [Rhizophagus diaphanus]|nr:hypothetical protein C1646_701895 [Rhizophagus diaphanus] [Rhizophagus sp. MUCL 43196]